MNKDIKRLVESFVIDSSIFDIDDESYLIDDYYKYYPKTKQELIDNINELLSKGITDLNCICTSDITDMSGLFDYTCGIKPSEEQQKTLDISRWDVSSVTNMKYMFCNCSNMFTIIKQIQQLSNC